MKLRYVKLTPRPRLLGNKTFIRNHEWPKGKFKFLDWGEHGYDDHNSWEWILILRYK